MNRNTKFITPFGVTHKGRRFYRAMINGAWVDDDEYARLHRHFEAARKEHRRAVALARKATRVLEQCLGVRP